MTPTTSLDAMLAKKDAILRTLATNGLAATIALYEEDQAYRHDLPESERPQWSPTERTALDIVGRSMGYGTFTPKQLAYLKSLNAKLESSTAGASGSIEWAAGQSGRSTITGKIVKAEWICEAAFRGVQYRRGGWGSSPRRYGGGMTKCKVTIQGTDGMTYMGSIFRGERRYAEAETLVDTVVTFTASWTNADKPSLRFFSRATKPEFVPVTK